MNHYLTTLGLALALLAWALPGQAAVVEPGHSALWYDPDRNGEGLVLEIHSNNEAWLTWFTWDEDGNQRWLIGQGTIVRDDEAGDHIEFPELIVTRGGRFGPDFDPAQVERTVAGSATLVFQDCYEGQFSYGAFGQQGELALHRLSHTMGAGCRPLHGRPGDPVYGHAGQSGIWYDGARDGEGWFLQWQAHNEAVATWFTYDSEGNQAWLLGTGQLDDDGTLVFEQMRGTRGARFGAGFDPADVEIFDWGRMELAIGCDTGSLRYESLLPEYGTGGYDGIERLSALTSPATCPWVAPAWTDLYDLEVIELPGAPQPRTSPPIQGPTEVILVTDVADDGTVAGQRRHDLPNTIKYKPVVFPAGAEQWLTPLDTYIQGQPRLAADGSRILLTLDSDGSLVIVDETGQEPVPGLDESRSDEAVDASADLGLILGVSSVPYSEDGWIYRYWLGAAGQPAVPLPTPEPFAAPRARCVSDDGSVVIGTHAQASFSVPPPYGGPLWAIRWLNGEPAELLHDKEGRPLAEPGPCSADGDLTFGRLGQTSDEDQSHDTLRPGFIRGDGLGAHLDLGLVPEHWSHRIIAASGDGSLVAGNYGPRSETGEPVADTPPSVFLWTQDTGPILLGAWLEEGGPLADWPRMEVAAVSANGEYVLVTTGQFPANTLIYADAHSALIRLTPK